MAELKTQVTGASVEHFLSSITDEEKQNDCRAISKIMEEATGEKPKMWGTSIVGFGAYHYRYATGREADWMLVAFSPRKQNITLYIMPGFDGYDELMKNLGKHSGGKSCVYIKRLSDIHLPTLKKLVRSSIKHTRKLFPDGA